MSPSDTRRLCVPGTDDGIRTVMDALEAFAAGHRLSKAMTWPVEVSLDEVLVNVVRHGLAGRGETAIVEVELRLDLDLDPPDTSLGIEDRPIGGLGISLVRRLMDETEYERREGKNRLRPRRRLVEMDG